MIIIFSHKKTEIYSTIKEELKRDKEFKWAMVNAYCDELEDLGLYNDNWDCDKVTNALFKFAKEDVRACFEDCYNSKACLKNSSKYRGPIRLADHVRMSSNSSCETEVNIIWE